jgi:hypothetical protein
MVEEFKLIIERVAWLQSRWTRAASALRRLAKGGTERAFWCNTRRWSARGFPLYFLHVLKPSVRRGPASAMCITTAE